MATAPDPPRPPGRVQRPAGGALPLRLVQRIGRYEVLGTMGRGTSSTVFRAFDPALRRAVALKRLDRSPSGAAASESLDREGWVAGALDHPNIARVYDKGWDEREGVPFLVLELVPGVSLTDRLATSGRLAATRALEIGVRAASALAHAHAIGVVHRDVRPAKILVGEGELVKLIDFGLARLPRPGPAAAPLAPVVRAYAAPEVVFGGEVDGRADQFSLATTLYEALTGLCPFRSESALDTATRIATADRPPLTELGIAVPPIVQDTLDRMHAVRPDDRFSSGAEWVAAMAASLAALRAH
jgi:serine/threonine protein kinase